MLKYAFVLLGASAELSSYGKLHGLKDLLDAIQMPEKADLQAPLAGACSAQDLALMRQAGSGNADNTFPGMIAKCGGTSWSIFKGFEEDVFDKCLTGTINISTGCANCFAGAGKYGFDHCKSKCLASWCSQSCLNCSLPYDDTLNQCVGTDDLPTATPC